MQIEAPTGLPGYGMFPANIKRRFINRTGGAVEIGQVLMLDIAASATETTTTILGDDNSVFANMVVPSSAAVTAAGTYLPTVFGVAMEAIADNASGTFLLAGITKVLVEEADGSTAIGEPLALVATTGVLDASPVAGEKIVGIALAAATGITTAEALVSVWFDGFGGFGIYDVGV